MTLDEQGHTDEAMNEVQAIVAAHPQDPDAWSSLGSLQRAAKKFEDAAKSYDKAIELIGARPTRSIGRCSISAASASSARSNGRRRRPISRRRWSSIPTSRWCSIISAIPGSIRAINLDEAFKMLQRAVDLKPTDGYIVDSLGWAHFKLGHYEEAAQELEKRDRAEARRSRRQRPSRRRLLDGRPQDRSAFPVEPRARHGSRAGGLSRTSSRRSPTACPTPRLRRLRRADAKRQVRDATRQARRISDVGSAPATRLWRAPAKVNLSLHVLGRGEPTAIMSSKVWSPSPAPATGWRSSPRTRRTVGRRFRALEAGASGPEADNLVLKAARALGGAGRRAAARALSALKKLLPVAAGLGGGSSDAAAALRALAAHNDLALATIRGCGRRPRRPARTCRSASRRGRAMMAGIGHEIRPARRSAAAADPARQSRASRRRRPAVFAALGLQRGAAARFRARVDLRQRRVWMERLAAARNDLQSRGDRARARSSPKRWSTGRARTASGLRACRARARPALRFPRPPRARPRRAGDPRLAAAVVGARHLAAVGSSVREERRRPAAVSITPSSAWRPTLLVSSGMRAALADHEIVERIFRHLPP